MEPLQPEGGETLLQRLNRAHSQLSRILDALRSGNPDEDYGAAERSVVGDAIALLYEAGQIDLDMSSRARTQMVDKPGPVSEDDIASLLSWTETAICKIQAADADDWPEGQVR